MWIIMHAQFSFCLQVKQLWTNSLAGFGNRCAQHVDTQSSGSCGALKFCYLFWFFVIIKLFSCDIQALLSVACPRKRTDYTSSRSTRTLSVSLS